VRNPTRILYLAAALLMLCSCGSKKKKDTAVVEAVRPFPKVEVPSIYTDKDDILGYRAEHFWDEFFMGDGRTDSLLVLGVDRYDVEQNLSNFIMNLDYLPLDKAQYCMRKMFLGLEAAQRRDTSNHVYPVMTEMVAHYLYDPNSPVRDEDYYQPFVTSMSTSDLTPENMKAAFVYQSYVTSLNKRGTKAADFKAKDIDGNVFTLYGVKGDYTLLFFSNPGCQACKEIITELKSMPNLDELISSGRLAIVNVYIDDDLESWKNYEFNYPDNWYNGYNFGQAIRNEQLYDVRAIPSLYLLDKDKNVIFKDAPQEKVLGYLKNLP